MENQDVSVSASSAAAEFLSFISELLRDPELLQAAAENYKTTELLLDKVVAIDKQQEEILFEITNLYELHGGTSDQIVTLAAIVNEQSDIITRLSNSIADLERALIKQRLG